MAKKAKRSTKTGSSKRATPASIQRERFRVQREIVSLLNRYASLTQKLDGDLPPLRPHFERAFEKVLSKNKHN